MKYVGYYNGEIGPLEEMKIPMLDRAVYFGDGCYDATTFANNNIFAADDHLDRFYNSCKLLEIPFEMSREELRAELQKCIDANEILAVFPRNYLSWTSVSTCFRKTKSDDLYCSVRPDSI